MSIDQQVGSAPEPEEADRSTGRNARTRVVAAIAGGVAFFAAVTLVALLGSAAEDNWLAWTLLALMAAGLITSLVAFVLALVARIRGAGTAWGWVPLCVFPAIIVFVVLGEALWWE